MLVCIILISKDSHIEYTTRIEQHLKNFYYHFHKTYDKSSALSMKICIVNCLRLNILRVIAFVNLNLELRKSILFLRYIRFDIKTKTSKCAYFEKKTLQLQQNLF